MKILFKGFESTTRGPGLGDLFDFSQSCYLKGKDIGYDDIHIVFPRIGTWGNEKYGISKEDYNWQKTEFLPWKWYPRNKDIDENEWDKIVDMIQPNSLYDGFPGIDAFFWYVTQYLGYYFKDKKLSPCIQVKRDTRKHYILFHYRTDFPGGFNNNDRTTSLSQFQSLFYFIKEILGDEYSYWKIGDSCPIENQFDGVIPNRYDKLDELAKLICNASLIVPSQSGIWEIASLMPNLPMIGTSFVPHLQTSNLDAWKKHMPDSKIENGQNWAINRIIYNYKNEPIDKEKIKIFLKKHKLL